MSGVRARWRWLCWRWPSLLGSLIVTGFGVPAPFIVGGGLIILLGLGALAFAFSR